MTGRSPGPDRPHRPHGLRRLLGSLTSAAARTVDRQQVTDLPPVAAPISAGYRLGAKTCRCCGTETTAACTDNTDVSTEVTATPGRPMRIGPAPLAMCTYLTRARRRAAARRMAGRLGAAGCGKTRLAPGLTTGLGT